MTKKIFVVLSTILTFALVCAGQNAMAGLSLALPVFGQTSLNLGAAELLVRQFTSEIRPKLFPSSSFLSRAINDDAFVNGDSVQLAHSGTIPNVTVNRSSLPATIARRTDAATEYPLEELTTDPTLLGMSEALTVAYNKRSSILDQHAKQINTKAADRALYKWAAGATGNHILKATGATRTASGPSQTGTRTSFNAADFRAVRTLFFSDDVVTENTDVQGIAVLTPAMYADLLAISEVTDASKYGRASLPSGVIDRLLGFDIYIRSRVIVYDTADALKAEGAAAVATDQDAALFYHPDYVRRAVGATHIFVNAGVAEYYGDIFSALQRFGALAARNDNKGIVTLMESNG